MGREMPHRTKCSTHIDCCYTGSLKGGGKDRWGGGRGWGGRGGRMEASRRNREDRGGGGWRRDGTHKKRGVEVSRKGLR